jgi:hypothetical protein
MLSDRLKVKRRRRILGNRLKYHVSHKIFKGLLSSLLQYAPLNLEKVQDLSPSID